MPSAPTPLIRGKVQINVLRVVHPRTLRVHHPTLRTGLDYCMRHTYIRDTCEPVPRHGLLGFSETPPCSNTLVHHKLFLCLHPGTATGDPQGLCMMVQESAQKGHFWCELVCE